MSGSSDVTKDFQSIPVISSITYTILESPPSCIEFSPLAPDLFVVGTYSLDPDASSDATTISAAEEEAFIPAVQSRSGSVILFRLDKNKLYANLILHNWRIYF